MAKGQTASGTSVRELERCQRGHRDVDSRHRFPSGGVALLTSAAPRMPHLGPARPKLCPGPAAAKWTVRKSPQAPPEGWAQVDRGARGREMDILTPGRPFEVQEASPSAKEMPRLQGQRQALFRVPSPPSTFQQESSRVMMGDSHGSAGSCLLISEAQPWVGLQLALHTKLCPFSALPHAQPDPSSLEEVSLHSWPCLPSLQTQSCHLQAQSAQSLSSHLLGIPTRP